MKTTSALLVFAAAAVAQAQLSVFERTTLERSPMIFAAQSERDALLARGAMLKAPYRFMANATGVAAAGDDMAIFAAGTDPRNYLLAAPDPVGIGSIMAMLPLFVGGRDSLAARAAEALRREGDAIVRTATQDALRETRMAFAEAISAREMLEASEAAVVATRSLLAVTEQRFTAGSAPEAFVLSARAAAAAAERRRSMAQAEAAAAISTLKSAAGLSQEESMELGDWDVPLGAPATLADALAQAKGRPELAAAQARAEALQSASASAVRSLQPELNLVGMASGMATEFDSEVFYKVGLVLSVPLADGGMRRAEAREKRAMAETMRHEMRRIELMVERDVARAWARWQASPAAVQAADAAVEAAREAYRIAVIRYEEGRSPQVEADQAAAELREAQAGRAEAHAFRRIAWADLMRAIGKSTDQEDLN